MLVGFSLLGAFEWCLSKFFHFLSLITKSKTEVDIDSLSSKTKLGLLMKMLLYLGLLICALTFCNKSIKEYKKGIQTLITKFLLCVHLHDGLWRPDTIGQLEKLVHAALNKVLASKVGLSPFLHVLGI